MKSITFKRLYFGGNLVNVRQNLVAEYDTNAQCWYDEAFENPIEIIRWKRI
jgi:hypothetical protein